MKNIFLFLDSVTDRTLSFQIEYVLNISVGSIILMAEDHYSSDLNYFFGNKRILIYNTLPECVDNCDIIIVSNNHLSQLESDINKEIIVVDLNESKYENLTCNVPDLKYTEKPVIAILSVGEFCDQYNTEILVNKILSEKGAKIAQYFSPFTKSILDSCCRAGCLNIPLLESRHSDYDTIVVAINGFSNYPNLIRTMCTISPDMILLCVNKSYNQEAELKQCLYGCGNIETIIKSPYIPYGLVKGKNYPVYCGHTKSSSYTGSFEDELYGVLKESILRCIYLPKSILLV